MMIFSIQVKLSASIPFETVPILIGFCLVATRTVAGRVDIPQKWQK
jgi:hypothetical protein